MADYDKLAMIDPHWQDTGPCILECGAEGGNAWEHSFETDFRNAPLREVLDNDKKQPDIIVGKIFDYDDWVRCVCFSNSGKFVATGDDTRAVVIRSFSPNGKRRGAKGSASKIINRFECQGAVRAVTFSPDDRLIASGDSRGMLTVRNWQGSGDILFEYAHKARILCLDFKKDGSTLASGDDIPPDPEERLEVLASGDLHHS